MAETASVVDERRVMNKYEITFLDTGKTVVWTEQKSKEFFGKAEWLEYKGNYLPHVFVAKV
jgi:hypothetical protein